MRLSAPVEAAVAIVVAIVVGLVLVIAAGCSSAPPEIRSGGLEGTLVLRSPSGPVTIDLGTQAIVADGEGWGVEAYQASGWIVVDYQGISHRVAVDAAGRCVVAHYTGVAVLDWQIPGTVCGAAPEPEPASEPEPVEAEAPEPPPEFTPIE